MGVRSGIIQFDTAMSLGRKTGLTKVSSMFSTGMTDLAVDRAHDVCGETVRARGARPSIQNPLLIAAKSSFQPAFELMKQELEVRSGRLLEQLDNTRTQILPGVINCSEQTHIGPEVAVLLAAKDFFWIWQPIEIFTGEPKPDRAAQTTLLNRYFSLDPKFSFLFDGNVIDVDLRILPSKAQRTII